MEWTMKTNVQFPVETKKLVIYLHLPKLWCTKLTGIVRVGGSRCSLD